MPTRFFGRPRLISHRRSSTERPMTDSARALSYESPRLPTEGLIPASDSAAQAHGRHQTGDRTARHLKAVPAQLSPYLANTVDLQAGIPDALDLGGELLVAPSSGRPLLWLRLTCLNRVVGRRSDRQHAADRLGSVNLPVIVDKPDKTEVIRQRGPWRGLEDVEFAPLAWVWWFNHHRLLEPIGHIPPAEHEEVWYSITTSRPTGANVEGSYSANPCDLSILISVGFEDII